jgi:hypothetical protein
MSAAICRASPRASSAFRWHALLGMLGYLIQKIGAGYSVMVALPTPVGSAQTSAARCSPHLLPFEVTSVLVC